MVPVNEELATLVFIVERLDAIYLEHWADGLGVGSLLAEVRG